jgi:hypothetical protein
LGITPTRSNARQQADAAKNMTSETTSPVKPVISPEALARLDGGRIAYVKQIRSKEVSSLFPQVPEMAKGFRLFALVAADGTPIIITDTCEAAIASARDNQLALVSVH